MRLIGMKLFLQCETVRQVPLESETPELTVSVQDPETKEMVRLVLKVDRVLTSEDMKILAAEIEKTMKEKSS